MRMTGSIPAHSQVDLPAALGVDLLHCQEAARQAAAGAGAHDILLAQDELFAREYFDDLAAEVDEVLEEQGMAPVGASSGLPKGEGRVKLG